jgi:mannonate dehydratase
MITMEQTMRWYGPDDPVSLADIRMAGATGIVTALHHIPNGEVWSKEEILKRKELIESSGLIWSVVESVPVHDDIKTGKGNADQFIENYALTLENLGECDVRTVCYNFMPVLDWTRTDLEYPFKDGSQALSFSIKDVALFDILILKRPGAVDDYSDEITNNIEAYYQSLITDQIRKIEENILKGLPGSEESFTLDDFRKAIGRYDNVDDSQLRKNMKTFLQGVIPSAEKAGVRLAIHPDDPPRPLFGLPRVVSTENDLKELLEAVDSYCNGFTMCTGSYGSRSDNDLPGMIERYGDRMHFIHLRNVIRDDAGNFIESDHLEGSVDMYEVVGKIIDLLQIRGEYIPMRPDHGHKMLDDLRKVTNPGYTGIGRLRGLAEIRGLEMGILRSREND